MTSADKISWRAGGMTLVWCGLLCLCLYIWYYIYLFVRWAIWG